MFLVFTISVTVILEEARRLNEEVARSRQVVQESKRLLKAQGEVEARNRAADAIKFAAEDRNLREQGTGRDVEASRERAQEAILRSAEQRKLSESPTEGTRRRFGVGPATGDGTTNAPESLAAKEERLKALLKAGKQAQLEGWDSVPPQPQGSANPPGGLSNPLPNQTATSFGSESLAEKSGRLRALLKAGKEAQQMGWDASNDQFDSSMMPTSPPQNPESQSPEG